MSNRKANKGRQTAHTAGPVKITKDTAGVSVQIIPEDEDHSWEDDFDDEETKEWIAKEHDHGRGNIWAWFCAHVRVTYSQPGAVSLTSDQYLGSCSYKDEADFRAGGDFDDMVSEAIDDLNKQIARCNHFDACAHCRAVRIAGAGAFPKPCSV